MKKPPALTTIQKNRLSRLRPQMMKACRRGDVESAYTVLKDIKALLLKTGHHTKYREITLSLCELLIMKREYKRAASLLRPIIENVSEKTRLYQEACFLLAVCLLHMNRVDRSIKLLKRSLDSKAIKNPVKRKQFVEEVARRFEEETLILTYEADSSSINVNDVRMIVQQLFQANVTDYELLEIMGQHVPPSSVEYMRRIAELAQNQISYEERKALPPPPGSKDCYEIGERVAGGLSKRIWFFLCNENGGVQKTLECLQGPDKIIEAIVHELAGQGITAAVKIIACLCAIVIRHSLHRYCEKYRPTRIMGQRGKKLS